MRNRWIANLILVLLSIGFFSKSFAESYLNFESHQFRPLAISPSGERLYVTNTPDSRLEIFDITGKHPVLINNLFVGLEPTAVAAKDNNEIWVVNHLSDSISIVDVSTNIPRIKQTLLVGDEPRDIVFAGKNDRRAFITTAHRGQNSPYQSKQNPGELTTPGVGRTDVWVFNANNPGHSLGGDPIKILSLFGDSPGPLAVSTDGKKVYVGVFKSGNQTTIVGRVLICDGGIKAEPCEIFKDEVISPGGLPPPNENFEGKPMPAAGLIVKWDGQGWKDELNRDWSNVIRFNLPDYDVFEIDADASIPYQLNAYSSIGTILYGMAVNPKNKKLYVANTDAKNEIRFEGPRDSKSKISSVMGHLHESRITIVNPSNNQITSKHLNRHIDYLQTKASNETLEQSLSMPVSLQFSNDGKKLYLAAKGSDKIAILDTQRLENNQFQPSKNDHIEIPGGGPAGILLDNNRNKLYVLNRFDNSLAVVDTIEKRVVHRQSLFNPEPDIISQGRPFFYNANLTSSNGESSCASCHVAGDKDEIAWDLGDPNESIIRNPNQVVGPLRGTNQYHPMKGPMLTQTIRGINGHGPLHWRGDRTAGNDPGGSSLDTEKALEKFNSSFVSLLGRAEELEDHEMQKLINFSLRIMPPPNPIRALDNSLNSIQQAGKNLFTKYPSVMGRVTCAYCHPVSPKNNIYGTIGITTNVIGGRAFKIPSHRNTYERVGMFGRAATKSIPNNGDNMGQQIRGYGFTHDGGADTVIRFSSYPVFQFSDPKLQRKQIEQYLFAFESNLKPIVGQQITLNKKNKKLTLNRIYLMVSRAIAGDTELIATGIISGKSVSYLLVDGENFRSDRKKESTISFRDLLNLASSTTNTLTFTAVPIGSGYRMALDQNEDGILNGDSMKFKK
ncbi:MAG: hypothetical protein VYA80_04800 [Pseudomonadota bacterium]|nr:hypothetical protein [Pseudomonadota bacterium]